MIYFDNAATTRVTQTVCEKVADTLKNRFGNPSSLYDLGFEAQKELDSARRTVAAAVGCNADELYFTASGTESNNIAVLGSARARRGWGGEVVITGYEHPSVNNAAEALEKEGFTVIKAAPEQNGEIIKSNIIARVNKNTSLVALMHINNETGAVLDVNAIAKEIKKINPRTAVHCDNVQGFMKSGLCLGFIDTLSISGHKIHAPKGIGALYIRRNFNIEKTVFGGLQEKGLRPGTENVAYASGLAEAVRTARPVADNIALATRINAELREGLSAIDGVVINSPENASPFILNISILGYRSETLLHFFEERGIYVSSGSACSRGEKSHTLSAMKLAGERIDSAIRLSFCEENTAEEAKSFIDAVKAAKNTLVKATVHNI